MRKLIFLMVLMLPLTAIGMEKDSLKYGRSGVTLQAGTLFDQSRAGFNMSATLDFYITNRLTAGPGLGFDSYHQMQAMPLFGSVRYDFGTMKHALQNKVFLQLSYGWSYAWLYKDIRDNEYGFKNSDGGRFANYQIGYRIAYDKIDISFMVGLKGQRSTLNYEYPNYSYSSLIIYQGSPNRKTVNKDSWSTSVGVAISWK
jgi:hypothetical protein